MDRHRLMLDAKESHGNSPTNSPGVKASSELKLVGNGSPILRQAPLERPAALTRPLENQASHQDRGIEP